MTEEYNLTESFDIQASVNDVGIDNIQRDALDRLTKRLIKAGREDILCRLTYVELHDNMTGEKKGHFRELTRDELRATGVREPRSEWADYILHRMVKSGLRDADPIELLRILRSNPTGDQMKEIDPEGKLLAVAIEETQRRQAIAFLESQPVQFTTPA